MAQDAKPATPKLQDLLRKEMASIDDASQQLFADLMRSGDASAAEGGLRANIPQPVRALGVDALPPAKSLIADRGYDSTPFRQALAAKGIVRGNYSISHAEDTLSSPLRVRPGSHGARAMRRMRTMAAAAYRKAVAEAIEASASFQSLRFRLIQAKKRSTTHRRGWTAKPI